jgi:predicted AlkP superfamily phosphohydrolase/phosphomutase
MASRRLLILGLDGYEATIGDSLMAQGRLPNLRRLRDESLRFDLDHGVEKYSGVSWEQWSTGQSPRTTGRWSALHFDASAYDVIQMPTELAPFFGALAARSVVFDCPYFDLERAPSVQGLVGWGAHDPGVALQSRPVDLASEVRERFGDFVGKESLYGFTWPSGSRTQQFGRTLVDAADQRAEVARWLLAERLPDWDVGLVVTGELHSAIEPLWHGLDARHPLHSLPSAEASATAVTDVYVAVDRLVGTLTAVVPEAAVLAFAMNGMGPNESDVPSMVLLPELLYRRAFGRPLLAPRPEWTAAAVAMLGEEESWEPAIRTCLVAPRSRVSALRDALRPARAPRIPAERREQSLSVEWIPATQYRRFWPAMPAFALPAYYHGRIRLNLRGREARGKVRPTDYDRVCADLIQCLTQCTNARTGEAAVRRVERFTDARPLFMNETDADLEVIWNGNPTALDHPTLGRIGPVPHRRTGGHTGASGVAWVRGCGIAPADGGRRSSFDVVPTVFDLLGEAAPSGISGRSLLDPPC